MPDYTDLTNEQVGWALKEAEKEIDYFFACLDRVLEIHGGPIDGMAIKYAERLEAGMPWEEVKATYLEEYEFQKGLESAVGNTIKDYIISWKKQRSLRELPEADTKLAKRI
jgi:hypothetical protein